MVIRGIVRCAPTGEVKDEIVRAALYNVLAADRYCADGGDGSGRNMLGRLLMRIREELP